MSSAAAPSDSGAAPAPPKILYLLTAKISSVLVRGQLDWLTSAGFVVHVGADLGADEQGTSVHRWDSTAQLHHVPYTRRISPVRDLRALIATIRLIRRLRPDIVNASTPKAGLLGMIAARVCRVPVRVYVLRGLRFETTTGLTRRLLVGLERVTEWCATRMLVNSPSALAAAQAAGVGSRRNPEMVSAGSSNGVDVDHFAPASAQRQRHARAALGIPHGARVLGFIGRLTRDKGITDVLAAFESLQPERADLHLLLVGDHEPGDPVSADVERRIADRSDVTQLSWVTDTATIYPAIDVLVFASAREGLPNVPLQAQASGVPVVAYAATGTVDALDDGVGGVLVTLGDTAAFTTAVAEVIDDPERRRMLGADGAVWVRQRFDQREFWDELADRYRTWMSH